MGLAGVFLVTGQEHVPQVADERGLRLGSPAAAPCGANCVLADPFEVGSCLCGGGGRLPVCGGRRLPVQRYRPAA